MRALLALLTVLMLAFAGCTSSDDPADETDTGDTGDMDMGDDQTSNDDGDETQDTDGGDDGTDDGMDDDNDDDQSMDDGTGDDEDDATNQIPTAVLSATVLSGDLPLEVMFDLSGSDADGDSLTWGLDVDGDGELEADGTELPANYTHTYTVAGNYTASFGVTDGKDVTIQNVTILVTEAAPQIIQTVSGSFLSGIGAGCSPVGGFFNAADGVLDHFSWIPDAATWGQKYDAVFTSEGMPLDYQVQWWQGSGTVLGTDSSETAEFSGTVPEGTDNAIVTSCGPGAMYTVTIEVFA